MLAGIEKQFQSLIQAGSSTRIIEIETATHRHRFRNGGKFPALYRCHDIAIKSALTGIHDTDFGHFAAALYNKFNFNRTT